MKTSHQNAPERLFVAAAAAFCVYFCMYAFRKPFTAGTFEDQLIWGYGLKSVLVISQLAGYMLSKFIGIKVISEMRKERRAAAIIGLIAFAELALVGFAYASGPLRVVMMFLNGLPLGMVFGLVLGFLEGRRQTEALTAALCASFIISSGVVKTVGQWLMLNYGVSEFQMPMLVGLMFFPPLLVSVWVLKRTPPPDLNDVQSRSERNEMDAGERREFVAAFWPGLSMLLLVFIALTIVRTIRDDFAVEIWQNMGISKTPSIFAQSETLIAIAVTALNAGAIWIRHNLAAVRATIALMGLAFALGAASVFFQTRGTVSPFLFMVSCGVALYVPYVAFHTTVFERLIAASRKPCNLGFLMYLADSLGYLGYAFVLVLGKSYIEPGQMLYFFRWTMLLVAGISIFALVAAVLYFERRLGAIERSVSTEFVPPADELASVK